MNKKSFLAALLLMLAGLQTAWAQSVIFDTKTGNTDTYSLLEVESITFSESSNANGHEWVDLELPSGTLWATTNVGANAPEEYGDFFAWGETQPKDNYSWDTYQYAYSGDGSTVSLTKYSTNGSIGYNPFADYYTELLPEDDAATSNWGSEWQMPSNGQFKELMSSENTSTEWVTQNGQQGLKITSLRNGKSIFLPGAGYYEGTQHDAASASSGYHAIYWSRSLYTQNCSQGCAFYGGKAGVDVYSNNRFWGQTVRPVRVKEMKEHEYVDLGLPSGTLWATTNIGANTPEEYGDYFAWGETRPKDDYSSLTYRYCYGYDERLTKYCNQSQYGYNGFTDYLTELLPEDDAATAIWGNEWQIPSLWQFEELMDEEYTTALWTTRNGVNGYLITSKQKGNDNSIFLPAAGAAALMNGGTYLNVGLDGYYQSCTLGNDCRFVSSFGFSRSSLYWSFNRYNGQSIRPVRFAPVLVSEILLDEKLSLNIDKGCVTAQLSSEVLPSNASNKEVIWESSDNSVATVDQTGMVKAQTPGICFVTCRATDGSGVSAECKVIVGGTSDGNDPWD